MTTTSKTIYRSKGRPSRGARRAGYVVSALINVALIIVVQNILEWGWLPFLTDEFEEVVPITVFSLTASAIANAVFVAYDALPFKTLIEIGLSIIALIVIVRTYQVFPFEFTSGPWTGITRFVMILAGFGVTIGIITEAVQLLTGKRSSYADD